MPHDTSLTSAQEKREHLARQAALGRRAEDLANGRAGAVLKRWINGSVVPIAERLRCFARFYVEGDMAEAAALVDSPVIELSQKERPLLPLMEWCLTGGSLGRGAGGTTTHAEDIVLSFMGICLTQMIKGRGTGTVNAIMSQAAEAVRETVQGQFITGVQGAGAMAAFKAKHRQIWMQKKSLKRIAAQLQSQVKPQALGRARDEALEVRGRQVYQVIDYAGRQRRIETRRAPEALDWAILSLAWPLDENDTSAHTYRPTWLAFVGVILACAQKEAGWFEVGEGRRKEGKGHKHRKSKVLILSDKAHASIKADVDRWLQAGFTNQPMLTAPVNGDYITVKHRQVTGQRPAQGLYTDPGDTDAWDAACFLANTPWRVNPHALAMHREDATLIPDDDLSGHMRLAEHRREAKNTFYLPVSMDFRGRIYYRTPWITPQSGDLGKSMLYFARGGGLQAVDDVLVPHLAALYDGPEKLSKGIIGDRLKWGRLGGLEQPREDADCPLTFEAQRRAYVKGVDTDCIPVQLDGTCNGLQHLAALFRDEEAAPFVNLTASTGGTPPQDIYKTVAEIAGKMWACSDEPWAVRMREAGLVVDRSLCKGPVMVLPYGGTREAVRLSVKRAVLEQMTRPEQVAVWQGMTGDRGTTRGGYEAFAERDLYDHPGFNLDVQCLAMCVWESIAPVIPKPMAAMEALAGIGKWIGPKALAWQTYGGGDRPLWVIQAKSLAAMKRVAMKGFHLPDMIRRLTLLTGTNEVDPKSHRTGIVANFIHSQDAAHLAGTINRFAKAGGSGLGAIHDCILVRPSEAGLVGECLREAFIDLYTHDPLSMPVKTIALDTREGVEYRDWYVLAGEAGIVLPSRGSFDIEEVRQSAWFFS